MRRGTFSYSPLGTRPSYRVRNGTCHDSLPWQGLEGAECLTRVRGQIQVVNTRRTVLQSYKLSYEVSIHVVKNESDRVGGGELGRVATWQVTFSYACLQPPDKFQPSPRVGDSSVSYRNASWCTPLRQPSASTCLASHTMVTCCYGDTTRGPDRVNLARYSCPCCSSEWVHRLAMLSGAHWSTTWPQFLFSKLMLHMVLTESV